MCGIEKILSIWWCTNGAGIFRSLYFWTSACHVSWLVLLYFLNQIGDLRHLGGLCGWLCGGLVEHQVSYVDLLGVVRSKLVPLSAIQTMERTGAGFAGYAAHFLMTAADSDMVDVYSLLHVRIVNTSQKQKWNFFCIDVQVAWTSLFWIRKPWTK